MITEVRCDRCKKGITPVHERKQVALVEFDGISSQVSIEAKIKNLATGVHDLCAPCVQAVASILSVAFDCEGLSEAVDKWWEAHPELH